MSVSPRKDSTMKTATIAMLVMLWCGQAMPSFAAAFEGVITLKETSGDETETRTFYFKGEKMRVDDGDAEFSVWDAKKKDGFFVDRDDHTYTTMIWSDLGVADAKSVLDDITVTKTGKNGKIAGYSCEGYVAKDKSDGSMSELCIAKGLSNAALYGVLADEASSRGGYPSWFRDFLKDGGFPLRQIDYDETGKEESRSEVTKIDAKRLDDGLFHPPAGFKKLELRK